MKSEWNDYLKQIGIKDQFYERVTNAFYFFNKIFNDIQGIFVSEYVNLEGRHEYESLFFFTPTVILEAKRFITEENYDATPFNKKVTYWCIQKSGYDQAEATLKSRIKLDVSLINHNGCQFKASGENCDHLWGIFQNYVVPNIVD